MGGETFSALTIAGVDSCGGAGTTADLKTFAAFGVRGFAVVACLTAQTPSEVMAVEKVSPELIDAMFSAAAKHRIDAAKTGMLLDEETVVAVCRNIRDRGAGRVVADPVISSGSGARLLSDGGIDALKKELLPLCEFVTPNTGEAKTLCGVEIRNGRDMETAAREIAAMGARKVVITGGHLEGDEVTDLFFDGKDFFRSTRKRVSETEETHGTGCVFSSALCALAAKGAGDFEAVRRAGEFTADMIKNSRKGGEEKKL